MLITAGTGFALVPWLKKLKYGQTIKEIGPTWHKGKEGTPTMGGLMFVIGSLIAVAAAYTFMLTQVGKGEMPGMGNEVQNLFIMILTSLAFGFVGFVDDFIKVVKQRNLGLMARYKIIMQVLITAIFLGALYLNGTLSTIMNIPFFGAVDVGFFFYPFSFLLIIAMVNAVNLTDGIDGLASSVTFVVALGFVVLSSLMGYFVIALFAAAIAGGCAGFLSWNFHPAKVFMGDTGSMFLGGAVVVLAYCIGRPEILFLIGIVYVCEAASVILQVSFFKITKGKRIFKMSPIHHHFEMCGWSEEKIVITFSFTALIGVILSCMYVYLG
ncbi:MAG: phospho-N-acetylmuramoyl-pentapeptide-transferase [Oscillospiraceae bacterium]